jgi:hypothetical protein
MITLLSVNETHCIAILKMQKCHFSFTKTENRKAKQVLSGGVGISGSGEDIRKGGWRVNMVGMFCTHVCKWKNETC